MRLILIAALALFTAACGGGDSELPDDTTTAPEPPAESEISSTDTGMDEGFAGGPCSYEETMLDAHVITVEDGQVELAETGGESFYIPLEDFDETPEAGEDFTIRWESITEGTCTPDIYTIVDGDVGGVE